MDATPLDVLVKPQDFERRAAGLRFARWKWDLLALVDGTRSIGALASLADIDVDLVFAFADECLSAELLTLEAVSYAQYANGAALAPPPAPSPVVEPPPLAAPADPIPVLAAPPAAADPFSVPGISIEMDPIGEPELPSSPAPEPPQAAVAPAAVAPPPAFAEADDSPDAVTLEIGGPPAPITVPPVAAAVPEAVAPDTEDDVAETEIAFEPSTAIVATTAIEPEITEAEITAVAVAEPEPEPKPEPEPAPRAEDPPVLAPRPVPPPPVVPPPVVPPPVVAAEPALPRTASLQERVAALKARALSAMQDAGPKPAAAPAPAPPVPSEPLAPMPSLSPTRSQAASTEEVEFSLSTPSTSAAEATASADAIEFSL